MTVIPSQIKSLLMTIDTSNAPAEGTPRQVTATLIAAAGSFHAVTIPALTGAGGGQVWGVLEALDGDCKGQKVLILAFDDGTDIATVTPFRTTAPTTLNFLYRSWGWPKATGTSSGSTTTAVSTFRTEADDTWNGYQMLAAYGANTDLEEISDFVAATDTFTFGAMAASTAAGDALMVVQALPAAGTKITADPGKAIERDIVTDTPAAEGVVIGASENVSLSLSPEIKGLAVAAGSGTQASPPNEMRPALYGAFGQVLSTGDTVQAASSATTVKVTTATRFAVGSMGMVNGDAFGVTGSSTTPTPDELTVPTGHIRTAPAENDIAYGAACYSPKATGHTTNSFLAWIGRSTFIAGCHGLAKWSAKVERNAIAKYDLAYSFIECMRGTWAQPHYDLYDSATPVVGRSNVNRVVYAGSEVAGEVLSAEFELIDAPTRPSMAFGAVENRGAPVYGRQIPTCKLTMYMEDTSWWHRYRAGTEADFLLQLGRSPTAAWAFWATRAQIVAAPDDGESDNLLTTTVLLRFLRPTIVQGLPAFTMAHF